MKWKGYKELTFEPRDSVMEEKPKMIKKFDKKHNVEWYANGRFTWVEKV